MKKEYLKIIEENNNDWKEISKFKYLTEDFIREFQDKVNWLLVSKNQKLSESFIREFQDKVNWSIISSSQILSEDFIIEFKDKVNWDIIFVYQSLSNEFIEKFYSIDGSRKNCSTIKDEDIPTNNIDNSQDYYVVRDLDGSINKFLSYRSMVEVMSDSTKPQFPG